MKPVYQSRVGENGRCMNACIASILEIPEAEVPDFGSDAEWLENLNGFLVARNLYYAEIPPDSPSARTAFEVAPGPVYHIITGLSPRGGEHAIVGDRGMPVWDPHPEDGTGRGLVEVHSFGLLCARMAPGNDRLHRALDRIIDSRRTKS